MKVRFAWVWVALLACGESGGSVNTPAGSRHVTQGGAQDIAHFRSIVARGQVPAPNTLDDVGFFAEHGADLPPADCGEDVCLHPMLAVAPRFDGGNWAMAFVGLNSPVDPSTIERPAMHVIVVAEQSFHTSGMQTQMRDGLRSMARELREGDRVSVVTMTDSARVAFHGLDADAVDGFAAAPSPTGFQRDVGLYEGLATAAELVELDGFAGETRIVLLTSGQVGDGIASPDRILGLAEALVQQRVGISVFGLGTTFEDDLVARIGDLGAGRYAYAEDAIDLVGLMRDEARLSLLPLATHFSLEVRAAPGYRVGRIYGARRAAADEDRAWLVSPALFLGRREGATGEGRRGGGGGLFVELIADADAAIGAGELAFTLDATWTARDGRTVTSVVPVENSLAPGQNPDDMWPEMSAPTHANVFMMLNMYLALKNTVSFFDAGDCARALGVVDMFAPSVEGWQARYPNDDIWADFELLLDVRDNVEAQCAETPVPPTFFEGSCFSL